MRAVAALLLVTCLLALARPVTGQEEARYNFASVQGSQRIVAPPGGEGRGTVYFYNVDGNRITHVNLTAGQAPAGWRVQVEPAQHEVEVSVNGKLVKVTENLNVEPSPLLAEEVRGVPQGLACLPVPGRGYAVAKEAHLVVSVPDSEEMGAKANIRLSAEASWLGQSGAAVIKQTRDFDFAVEVATPPGQYSEKVVGTADEDGELAALVWDWLPTIAAGAIVLVGAIVIPRRRPKR